MRITAKSLLVVTIFLNQSITAQNGADEEQNSNDTLPYEIVITPAITRTDLRELIVKVEDDFLAKFNELNIDDEYDVQCYKYVPTLSHISERVCEPNFILAARNQNVSETVYRLGSTATWGTGDKTSAFLLSPRAIQNEVKPSFAILQQKLEELNSTNEEFRSIGIVLAKLKARLENFGKE